MVIVRQSTYHRLKENNNRKKRALQELEKEIETHEQEKADLTEELAKLKQQNAGADLKAAISEKDAALQSLQEQLSASQKEVESLKNFNENTSSHMVNEVKEAQNQRDEAIQKLDEKVQYYESHVKSLEKNSANRKQQLIEAAGQIDSLRNTQEMLESQLMTSAQSRGALEKNLQQETMRREAVVNQLNEEISALQAALHESRSASVPSEGSNANSEEIERLTAEKQSLQGSLEAANQLLNDTNSKVEEMRSDNEQLATAVSSYHEKYRRLLAKVNDGKEEQTTQQNDAVEPEAPKDEEPKESVENPAPAQENAESNGPVSPPEDQPAPEELKASEKPTEGIDMEQHGLDDLAQIVQQKIVDVAE